MILQVDMNQHRRRVKLTPAILMSPGSMGDPNHLHRLGAHPPSTSKSLLSETFFQSPSSIGGGKANNVVPAKFRQKKHEATDLFLHPLRIWKGLTFIARHF